MKDGFSDAKVRRAAAVYSGGARGRGIKIGAEWQPHGRTHTKYNGAACTAAHPRTTRTFVSIVSRPLQVVVGIDVQPNWRRGRTVSHRPQRSSGVCALDKHLILRPVVHCSSALERSGLTLTTPARGSILVRVTYLRNTNVWHCWIYVSCVAPAD